MATVTKRGDMQWLVQVRRKGHPPQVKTFTLKADAERWGKEIEIAIERGSFFSKVASERNTIKDLIERYRLDELPKKKGKHFQSALNQLEEVFGKYALSGITSEMIAKHRDARLKDVSESTVKKEINLLSSIIDLAGKEWGIPIQANPCLMVKRPVEPSGRDRRLVGTEGKYLIYQCEDSSPEMAGLVRLALETGARLGELLSLKWADVDFKKRTARLRGVKNNEGVVVDRVIPLSSSAVAAITGLVRHLTDDRVFRNWKAADSFNKTWVRVCKLAGISCLKFHDLRHEGISRLFEKDLNVIEVASISGHKTLTVLKRYTHLNPSKLAHKLG
jgi:integrase